MAWGVSFAPLLMCFFIIFWNPSSHYEKAVCTNWSIIFYRRKKMQLWNNIKWLNNGIIETLFHLFPFPFILVMVYLSNEDLLVYVNTQCFLSLLWSLVRTSSLVCFWWEWAAKMPVVFLEFLTCFVNKTTKHLRTLLARQARIPVIYNNCLSCLPSPSYIKIANIMLFATHIMKQ